MRAVSIRELNYFDILWPRTVIAIAFEIIEVAIVYGEKKPRSPFDPLQLGMNIAEMKGWWNRSQSLILGGAVY